MNQIYKVIWSRVKHCYVVVSEIAGRCGKNGGTASEKKSMPVRAFLCALAVTGCLLPGMAEASFNGGIGATTATANSIAVGDDAKTTEEYTIALDSRAFSCCRRPGAGGGGEQLRLRYSVEGIVIT